MIRRQMAGASPSDQEDLLQEVLMSVHAARASYDPGRPFMPWLKAIVVNRAIDFLRRQRRHASGQALTDGMAAVIADNSAPDAVAATMPSMRCKRRSAPARRPALRHRALEAQGNELAGGRGHDRHERQCAQGVGAPRGQDFACFARALPGRMRLWRGRCGRVIDEQ